MDFSGKSVHGAQGDSWAAQLLCESLHSAVHLVYTERLTARSCPLIGSDDLCSGGLAPRYPNRRAICNNSTTVDLSEAVIQLDWLFDQPGHLPLSCRSSTLLPAMTHLRHLAVNLDLKYGQPVMQNVHALLNALHNAGIYVANGHAFCCHVCQKWLVCATGCIV